jgi:hypothetical protein
MAKKAAKAEADVPVEVPAEVPAAVKPATKSKKIPKLAKKDKHRLPRKEKKANKKKAALKK